MSDIADIVPIREAAPVLHGVLKVVWRDGYAAVVDLRPVIAAQELLAFLREDHAKFDSVRVEEYGHYISWIDADGEEVELGSDALRRRAERQAEILRLAS